MAKGRGNGEFENLNKYRENFNKATYERIEIVVKKGEKEKIKEYAKAQGKSISSFIVELIEEEMK